MSIHLPQRRTQWDNRNSLVFAPNAIALVCARFLQQDLAWMNAEVDCRVLAGHSLSMVLLHWQPLLVELGSIAKHESAAW